MLHTDDEGNGMLGGTGTNSTFLHTSRMKTSRKRQKERQKNKKV